MKVMLKQQVPMPAEVKLTQTSR